jgi:hypothetical protein
MYAGQDQLFQMLNDSVEEADPSLMSAILFH